MLGNRSALIAEIPHLRRYARALTRDPDRADDLVQASLERALGRFHLWKPTRKLRPWLFAIMHNLHVDMVRHQTRRGASISLHEAPDIPAHQGSQDETVFVRSVLEEIDRLPDEQRDAVILVGLDALSYAEAAEVLSVPQGTLMSRLHRGRARLRERLGMAERTPPLRRVK